MLCSCRITIISHSLHNTGITITLVQTDINRTVVSYVVLASMWEPIKSTGVTFNSCICIHLQVIKFLTCSSRCGSLISSVICFTLIDPQVLSCCGTATIRRRVIISRCRRFQTECVVYTVALWQLLINPVASTSERAITVRYRVLLGLRKC